MERKQARVFDRFIFDPPDHRGDYKWRRIGMDGNLVDESDCGFADKADCIADAVAAGYAPEDNGE